MTNEALVEKMKLLKQHWGVLKGDKSSETDMKISYESIMDLQAEIQELDPKFNAIDLSNTKYAEFAPKHFKSKVKPNIVWPVWDGKFGLNERNNLERWTSLAVAITKERLPTEPEDSQKFGMIVSATTDKLLTMANT